MHHVFTRATLRQIEQALHAGHWRHSGELRFVVEGALGTHALLHGQTPRERAIELFSLLRVWDTDHRNGVLLYVLLADRAVEIVADRGIHARVGDAEWDRIGQQMERDFSVGAFAPGTLNGIEAVARCLAAHFPPRRHAPSSEPGDRPVLL